MHRELPNPWFPQSDGWLLLHTWQPDSHTFFKEGRWNHWIDQCSIVNVQKLHMTRSIAKEQTKLLFPLRINSSPRFFFISKSSQQHFTSPSCWWVLLSLAYSLTHFVEHKVILVSYEQSAFWGQMFSQVEEPCSPCWPVQMWPDVTWSHFHLFSIYVHEMREVTQYYFSSC